MKLNEKNIAAIEAKGFKRWTKNGMDRLYINATEIGLELTYYKTGNISGAWFNGELLSNRQGYAYKAAKTYIDIETGTVHSDVEALQEAAQAALDEIMNAEEAEEETNMKNLSEMTDRQLIDYGDEMKIRLQTSNRDACPNYSGNVSAEEREEILKVMHEIRLEKWARGFNATPTADRRDEYEQRLENWKRRLETAIEKNRLDDIYVTKNMIWEYEDKLAYIMA